MLRNKPLLDFFYPSVAAKATYFTTQDTEQICQDGHIQKHFHNVWHWSQTKDLFPQARDQNNGEKRHLLLFFFFFLHLSVVDNLQEGRENFHLLSTRAGANSFGHSFSQTYQPRPPHISPPQGPWEKLSAPQKYCSSSFSLYWLPVSPQLFHLPHTLKPLLIPIGFALWTKHHDSDSNSKGDSTEIQHLHHSFKRTS